MRSSKGDVRDGRLAPGRTLALTVVILNVVLFACAVLSYGRYTAVYQERLREENLGNIANLNQSSALNATALVESRSDKLEDIVRFVALNDLTHDEALTAIEQLNSNAERSYELIGSDYTGFLALRGDDGEFIPVSYATSSYDELHRSFDDAEDEAYANICFTPEFTDGHTALKYFAVYRHLRLKNAEGGYDTYTLLLATESHDVLAVFNSQNGFADQSTVLMDSEGNYIVSNSAFKSTNFFKYLYVYNDLTLDERLAIESEFAENSVGELYYKDAAGRDCVFRYEKMTTNDWYCVTAVPLSSFRTPTFSVHYAIYAVGSLLLLMAIDLAWLRHLNRRLRLSVQSEKEASAAKTDFLSRMSHDIRTPLNGIIGLTTLAAEGDVSPETRAYLDNIKVSGEFLSGLVNDILDLSRVESGKVELNPEPYSCGDLCRYTEAVVAPLCREKRQEFIVREPDGLPPLLLDRLRFNQVMFNLLSNAVKYTPEGGRVELSWTRTPLANGRAALDITVRDNGIGMSAEFQKHMFESFTQERALTVSTGSGLGLTIVSSLVKLMNGSLNIKSVQGEGTEVTVHIEAAECAEAAQNDFTHAAVTLSGERVLLCEDNEINIIVAVRTLEKWDIAVDVARNGREGVALFSASEPWTYGAVLMDVMMPEMNGLEATRAIRALDREDARSVSIIAMTANAYDTDVKNCLEAGMDWHMGKPIDTERLMGLLSRAMEARGKVREGSAPQGNAVRETVN